MDTNQHAHKVSDRNNDDFKSSPIASWKDFIKHKKDYDLKGLDQMSLPDIANLFRKNYRLLVQDQASLFYLFPKDLSQKIAQIAREIVTEFKYKLDSDYESIYLGNPKQLLVYKSTNKSLRKYLSTYRVPNDHKKLFQAASACAKHLLKLRKRRNMIISQRKTETEEYVKLSEQMQKYEKTELESSMKNYCKLAREMITDFKQKKMNEEISFLGIGSIIEKSLKEIILEADLYFSYRFSRISEFDEHKDIIASKTNRNYDEDPEFDDYGNSESDDTDDLVIKSQPKKNQVTGTLQHHTNDKIKPPKPIESVYINQFVEQGIECQAVLLPFGKNNIPDSLQINILYPPKTEYQKSVKLSFEQTSIFQMQKINFLLDPVAGGRCLYSFRLRNEAGTSATKLIEVWVNLQSNQHKKTIKMHTNSNLYYYGKNENGLILNQNPVSQDKEQWGQEAQPMEITITTNKKWQKVPFRCTEFSVSSYAMICNEKGDVAGWGKMYAYNQNESTSKKIVKKGEDSDEEEDLGLGFIKSDTCTIEGLSLVLGSCHIRKVSCGELYCLMSDNFGQAWSFGLNNYGQLGQEQEGNNKDRSQPKIIASLNRPGIFITDVIASSSGASFAIDSESRAYRWGFNQIQVSPTPITDLDNNIINYSYDNIVFSQPIPLEIKPKQLPQKIKSIHPGPHFTLVLTITNNIYGWGNLSYLLANQHQLFTAGGKYENAGNVCNPIPVMQEVASISVCNDQIVAQRMNGELWGWGNLLAWRKPRYTNKAELLLQNFDGQLYCGPNFSALHHRDNPTKLEIIESDAIFQSKQIQLPCIPKKIAVSQGIILVMGE